jgi:hypothetical protein
MRRVLISFPHSEDGGNRAGRIPITATHLAHPALQKRHYTENSKQIFPKMKLGGLIPNSYIHISVGYLCIPRSSLPLLLQENRWTNRGNI